MLVTECRAHLGTVTTARRYNSGAGVSPALWQAPTVGARMPLPQGFVRCSKAFQGHNKDCPPHVYTKIDNTEMFVVRSLAKGLAQ